MNVVRVSDRGPSDFCTDAEKPFDNAVTDDPATRKHASLLGSKVVENRDWWNILVFSRDWLIACPSESISYSQSAAAAWRKTTHEHDTGGRHE